MEDTKSMCVCVPIGERERILNFIVLCYKIIFYLNFKLENIWDMCECDTQK